MITEKDLEKAADKYEAEQQEKHKDRDNHDFDNYRDGFVDGLTFTYDAFKDGANWQRNRVWHSISEKADSSKFVIFYDGGQYMSPPSRCPLSFETLVIAMNKKYGANYTMWAYMDDIVPKEILKFSNS